MERPLRDRVNSLSIHQRLRIADDWEDFEETGSLPQDSDLRIIINEFQGLTGSFHIMAMAVMLEVYRSLPQRH